VSDEGVAAMASRKDKVLDKISDEDLVALAKSALDKRIYSKVSRDELVKTVKDSLSIEEINKRVRAVDRGAKITSGTEANRQPQGGRVFSHPALLGVGLVTFFASLILGQYLQLRFFADYYGPYYYGHYNLLGNLRQSYILLDLVINMVKVLGLGLIVTWLFMSAVRAAEVNHTMAAIMALCGSILLAVVLLSLTAIYYPLGYDSVPVMV
jgi:hypothetical protein